MAWDVRQTYYYLVCFATLIMVIIGVVQVIQNGLDLALPEEPYRPSAMDMYQRMRGPTTDEEPTPFTREELDAMAEEEAERMRRETRRRNIRSLIGSLALVAVATPVYLYHWRRVRRDEVSGRISRTEAG